MTRSLTGKVGLVTGAAKGIGAGIAKAPARPDNRARSNLLDTFEARGHRGNSRPSAELLQRAGRLRTHHTNFGRAEDQSRKQLDRTRMANS